MIGSSTLEKYRVIMINAQALASMVYPSDKPRNLMYHPPTDWFYVIACDEILLVYWYLPYLR